MFQQGELVGDRYRVVRQLGHGGSATTYEAELLADGRHVALKHIGLRSLDDWKVLELFEREARVLAHLTHPSIPRYIDHFSLETPNGPSFFLAQELAPGRSLAAWRRDGWHPGEDELKELALRLLEVLRYLHGLNPAVIHRDIKPENVLRDDGGNLWLVDFGAVRDTPSSTFTAGSTIVGTFGYMAPEQLHGSARPASDLYGLGCTLLFLMTGRPPNDLPHRELKIDFSKHVSTSSTFNGWLERMIEPAPERRFASAHLALVALRDGKGSGTAKAAPSKKRVAVLAVLLAVLAGASVPILRALRVAPMPEAAGPKEGVRGITAPRPRLPRYALLKYVSAFPAHVSAILDIGFTRDGSALLTASVDQSVKQWSAQNGTPIRVFGSHSDKAGSVFSSVDGRHVVSGGDTTVKVWDAATGALVRTMNAGGAVRAAALSPDGKTVAVARLDGVVAMVAFEDGKTLRTLEHSKARLHTVAFSPDGRFLASAGDDKLILLWDAATGARKATFGGHTKTVGEVVFAPDSLTFISASDDRTARMWNVAAGRALQTMNLHTDEVWAVAFSPDGAVAATGGKEGKIGLWSTLTGKLLEEHNGAERGTLAMAFSPDGSRLATAHGTGNVRLWNVNGKRKTTVPAFAALAKETTPSPAESKETALYADAMVLVDEWHGRPEPLANAEAKLKEALTLTPTFALAHAGLARIALKRAYVGGSEYRPEGLTAAHAMADRALALDARCAEAFVVRAWLHRNGGDLSRAKAAAAEAEKLAPTAPSYLLLKADLMSKGGDLDGAEALLGRLITTTKDRTVAARAYGTLDTIYRERDDAPALDQVYRRVVDLEPESAWAKGNYANFLVDNGNFDKALEYGQAALRQMDYGAGRRTVAQAHTGKGIELLWDQGDLEGAKLAFSRAAAMDDTYFLAHYGLAAHALAVGDRDQAKRHLMLTLAQKADYAPAKTLFDSL
ncbi:MAG: protein kinase [Myxococcales bacterium]|nr:protein kinase [Myxococcales bacterium]